jgi:hypothetical protein
MHEEWFKTGDLVAIHDMENCVVKVRSDVMFWPDDTRNRPPCPRLLTGTGTGWCSMAQRKTKPDSRGGGQGAAASTTALQDRGRAGAPGGRDGGGGGGGGAGANGGSGDQAAAAAEAQTKAKNKGNTTAGGGGGGGGSTSKPTALGQPPAVLDLCHLDPQQVHSSTWSPSSWDGPAAAQFGAEQQLTDTRIQRQGLEDGGVVSDEVRGALQHCIACFFARPTAA